MELEELYKQFGIVQFNLEILLENKSRLLEQIKLESVKNDTRVATESVEST